MAFPGVSGIVAHRMSARSEPEAVATEAEVQQAKANSAMEDVTECSVSETLSKYPILKAWFESLGDVEDIEIEVDRGNRSDYWCK